jgi:hypothetical protein
MQATECSSSSSKPERSQVLKMSTAQSIICAYIQQCMLWRWMGYIDERQIFVDEQQPERYTHIIATSGRTVSYRNSITLASRLAINDGRSECRHKEVVFDQPNMRTK